MGDLICFEVAVDPVVNRVINEGAQVLVVQTNNATYAGTALPQQQLNIERLRAIENDRTVVVAATTGISARITPDGSVDPILEDGEVGSFVVEVAPRRESDAGGTIRPLRRVAAVRIGCWSSGVYPDPGTT